MKYYILYIRFRFRTSEYSLLKINEESLNIVVDAYKKGIPNFTLSGKQYPFLNPTVFHIYEIPNYDKFQKQIQQLNANRLEEEGYIKRKEEGLILRPKFFQQIIKCKDVTNEYIGNLSFGELQTDLSDKYDYISLARIQELKQIENNDFDLTKVIQFCKEINDNWHRENFLSVGTLVRALKDHVPPIFGFKNFKEVASNYSGNGRSFSSSMKKLEDSSKHISDRLIHSHVQKKVALPTETQVNFTQDIDVMLEEIIRILK